jgi:predicted kinase
MEWTEATYAHVFREAEPLLLQGRSVLIDASFQRVRHRQQAMQLAQRTRAEFCVLD